MIENEIAKIVFNAAYHIHRRLGPVLLESVYKVIFIDSCEEWDQKHRFIYIPGVFEGTLMRFSTEKKAEICIEDVG